jgi:hypothetical protein
LPDGMSYAILVLPERNDMDLEVLQKLEALIKAGATVLGPKPTRTGTLVDYPNRDNQVKQLADKIWGDCDGKAIKEHAYGKGRVIWNRAIDKILLELNIEADFLFQGQDQRTRLDYIHRRTATEDIYFVSNKNERWETVECSFRIDGQQPELWHPETGKVMDLPVYESTGGRTRLNLHLAPAESVFVVFRRPADSIHLTRIESLGAGAADVSPVLYSHSATPGGPMWLSDGIGQVTDQHITFDLRERYNLKRIRIWNYNENVRGFLNRGVKDFDVLVSPDDIAYQQAGSFRLRPGPENEDKDYSQDITLQAENARYVRFEIKSNQNMRNYSEGISKYVGLSKVKFFAADEIEGVALHAVSSGKAFDPASDEELGVARPDAELKVDQFRRPYLLAWAPGTYVLHDSRDQSKKVEVESVNLPLAITGPWQVNFPAGWGAPARENFPQLISWTASDNEGIKHFSGRAVYRKEIDIPQSYLNSATQLELDLGMVQKVARVSLNGRDLGVLWKPPFNIEITDAVRPGKNELVIEVGNTWTNRLIGDAFLPEDQRYCKTNLHRSLSRKERQLQPSGLLGPVRIHQAKVVKLN